MQLATDRRAASPLSVIAVVAAVAILGTAAILWLTVDTEHEVLELNVVEDAGQRYLEVGRIEGQYAWGDLDIRLINHAGTDRAPQYLHAPTGPVSQGDRIPISPRPPAGDYLLEISIGDQLLTQRVVTL